MNTLNFTFPPPLFVLNVKSLCVARVPGTFVAFFVLHLDHGNRPPDLSAGALPKSAFWVRLRRVLR